MSRAAVPPSSARQHPRVHAAVVEIRQIKPEVSEVDGDVNTLESRDAFVDLALVAEVGGRKLLHSLRHKRVPMACETDFEQGAAVGCDLSAEKKQEVRDGEVAFSVSEHIWASLVERPNAT